MNKLSNWLNSFSNNQDPSLEPKVAQKLNLGSPKKDEKLPKKGFDPKRRPPQNKFPPNKRPNNGHVPGHMPKKGISDTDIKFESHSALKVIPLGGVNDTGALNCTMVEYKNDIIIVDAGLGFPEEAHPGVDYLIPDLSFLGKKKANVRGILITHGHLDHIGALPHFLKELNFPPVYASRYALALIRHRLKEDKLEDKAKLIQIEVRKRYKIGSVLESEWVHINHSLPDACAIFLRSPEGNAYFSGDFKIDYTPEKEETADFDALTRIKKEGVDLMLSDSLGADRPGHVPSERVIRGAFEKLFEDSQNKGRIVIALTASNSNRFQQIIDSAHKFGRKIGISGRSLETNLKITSELGYLKEVKGVMIPPERLNKLPDNKIVFLVTGSQGEEFAALNRISNGEHRDIQIKPGDTIVFSASEIPGNERSIASVRNRLMKLGARIVNDKVLTVHSSGHGCAEDKRLLLTLLKPKYFLPYHGEYFLRSLHGEIAVETGVKEENIFLTDDGMGIEIFKRKARIMSETYPAEKLVVDGTTVSNQEGSVLGERKIMGRDGILLVLIKRDKDNKLVGSPKLISKGFLYEDELSKMSDELSKFTVATFAEILKGNSSTLDRDIVHLLSRALGKQIRKITEREPIVLPILVNA